MIVKLEILQMLWEWAMYTLAVYIGVRLERWNVKRKAEKEAAQKWYEMRDREPKL